MSKLRKSAKGEDCTMRSSVCNYNTETTVLCHLNEYEFGKGIGKKADDLAAFYGCSACHDLYDGRTKTNEQRPHMKEMAYKAVVRTHIRMREKGVL